MPWLGFYLPKIIFLSLGLALFFLSLAITATKIFCSKKILLLLGAYFALLIVFTIFSQAPLSSFLGVSGAMQGLQTHLLYLGIFVLALTLNQQKENHFLKALIVIHILAVGYAILQWLNLDPLQQYWNTDAFLNRSFSFLGNPNWLGALMVLTMPLVLRLPEANKSQKLFWLIFILEWLVLLTTGSKAALIAAAFVSIILLWEKDKKKTIIFILLALLAGLSLFLFHPDLTQLLRSSSARQIIWADTWQILINWPWGHGLDTFRFSYPFFTNGNLYQYEDLFASIDNPHNLILQLLFEIGPLGLIVFSILLITVIKPHLKKTAKHFPLALGIVAYLITNIFGFETIVTGAVFWLLIGLLAKTKTATNVSPILNRTFFLVLSSIFVAIFYLNFNHLQANFYYQNSSNYLSLGEAEKAVINLQKAIAIYPYDRIYLLEASQLLSSLSQDTGNQYLSQVQTLSNNQDPDDELLQAWYFAKQGNAEEAEKYFVEALKQPNNPRNYILGMEIYQTLNQPEKVEQLRIALEKLLPTNWNKPETDSGRIFQKNYPWLVEKLEKISG